MKRVSLFEGVPLREGGKEGKGVVVRCTPVANIQASQHSNPSVVVRNALMLFVTLEQINIRKRVYSIRLGVKASEKTRFSPYLKALRVSFKKQRTAPYILLGIHVAPFPLPLPFPVYHSLHSRWNTHN